MIIAITALLLVVLVPVFGAQETKRALKYPDDWVLPIVEAPPPEPIKGGYTVVVLPDTQGYSDTYPELFYAQTCWIAENTKRFNIKYVLHLGDVVEYNIGAQWKIARKAFTKLDGKVPYAIAIGNHDMGPNSRCSTRDSLFSGYFPVSDFQKWPSFGGVYDKEPDRSENSYHLFDAAGCKWLILALEFGPRDDVLRWANQIVAKHPDRSVIIITHAYLNQNGRRYDRNIQGHQQSPMYLYPLADKSPAVNDSEQMWQKLVSKHSNIEMVLCGHINTTKYLASQGDAGNFVHQMMVDYSSTAERAGNGWLRLLQFTPDGKTVRVQDYSPVIDKSNAHPQCRFEMKLSTAPKGTVQPSSP